MDSPWKTLAKVAEDSEYIALLSYLPLKTYRAIPRFLQFSFQIQKQLRDTPGVIGYSLRAKLFNRDFWTLSVWENEKALMDFVAENPHGQAMKAMVPYMGPSKFTQWKVKASALPLCWEEAILRSLQERQP